MSKVLLIVVGKTLKVWEEITLKLEHQVNQLLDLKVIILKEETSLKNIETKKQVESLKILETVETHSKSFIGATHKILLSPNTDKLLTSQDYFKKILQIPSNLLLVIGGSNGVKEEMFTTWEKISLAKLVFSHSLARVIILELLKRAFLKSDNFKK